jgi:hypothetical protein
VGGRSRRTAAKATAALHGRSAITVLGLMVAFRCSDGRRLVEEHDRDVVPYRVSEAAMVAHERRFRLAIVEWALALRAHEDGE